MILPTTLMTRYKRFDVLVTAFPFADSGLAKKRPVVCVASFRPTPAIELYWVLMITSSKMKKWRGDIEIHDLKTAGLPIPSIIRTCKIACIDASLIEKRVGTLDDATKEGVHAAIVKVFE